MKTKKSRLCDVFLLGVSTMLLGGCAALGDFSPVPAQYEDYSSSMLPLAVSAEAPVAPQMFGKVRRWAENDEAVHAGRQWLGIVGLPGEIVFLAVEVGNLLGKVAEPPTADAVIGLRRLLEMHAA